MFQPKSSSLLKRFRSSCFRCCCRGYHTLRGRSDWTGLCWGQSENVINIIVTLRKNTMSNIQWRTNLIIKEMLINWTTGNGWWMLYKTIANNFIIKFHKGVFPWSTIFSPMDRPKHFTHTPWQTCSIQYPLGFSGKHSAILQVLCTKVSTTAYSQVLVHTVEWTGVSRR